MDKILIVDGSVLNTDLMRQCLNNSGFDIYTSESGLNALAKIQLFKPDLVILDIELPDVSGFDVCKKIKENPETENTIVLFLIDLEAKEARIRALEIGADDFIEKNFDSAVLLSKAKSLFRVKHLRDQLKQKYTELEEKNKILDFQLKMARSVQRSLIREIDYSFNGVKISSTYLPALDVGGDFYNIQDLDDESIAVVMGDVSGHGVSASLLTAMLNMMFKSLVFKYETPNEFLFNMNNQFCDIFENSDNEMYACVFYAIIHTKEKRIYYSNAGQSLPLFVDSQKNTAFELESTGLPIGILKDSVYDFNEAKYEDGDLLLFHTDGLSDVFYKNNPEEFSRKIKELLLEYRAFDPEDIMEVVLTEFYNYNLTNNEKYEIDDVSILLCNM